MLKQSGAVISSCDQIFYFLIVDSPIALSDPVTGFLGLHLDLDV